MQKAVKFIKVDKFPLLGDEKFKDHIKLLKIKVIVATIFWITLTILLLMFHGALKDNVNSVITFVIYFFYFMRTIRLPFSWIELILGKSKFVFFGDKVLIEKDKNGIYKLYRGSRGTLNRYREDDFISMINDKEFLKTIDNNEFCSVVK